MPRDIGFEYFIASPCIHIIYILIGIPNIFTENLFIVPKPKSN